MERPAACDTGDTSRDFTSHRIVTNEHGRQSRIFSTRAGAIAPEKRRALRARLLHEMPFIVAKLLYRDCRFLGHAVV